MPMNPGISMVPLTPTMPVGVMPPAAAGMPGQGEVSGMAQGASGDRVHYQVGGDTYSLPQRRPTSTSTTTITANNNSNKVPGWGGAAVLEVGSLSFSRSAF